MTARRVVSRGRVKVDARRAVAKLREHLLLDPDAWPLEVVRVAAMSGATGVSIEHDADDLRIAFDGKAPPAESVGRLLDFALESSREPGVRALRLLAIALNAAISTKPSRITVAVKDDDAGDARFRFDTSLHRRDPAGSEATSELPALEREPIDREGLRGASLRVEMNKGFSWGTFVRFAGQRALREVTLLRDATRRSAIPLTFDPEVPGEPREAPVMVVALEEHGLPGGILEVRRSSTREPRIELLEHGVLLADVALPPSLAIPVEGHGVHLPIDVHVDAESWPTNASRSQVHAREVTRVVESVHAVLPAIGRALGRIMLGEEPAIEGITKLPTAAEAERAAAAFACCAGRGGSAGALVEMLELPTGRDAVGRPMPAGRIIDLARRAMESAGSARVLVHRGDSPLPDAFAPFADDVVWLFGSPLDGILRGVHTRDFADVHREVAAGIARREAWLRQPATGPHVETSATELMRFAIDHATGPLRGLRGEVVVHLDRHERPSARVFVEGRLLATVPIDGTLPIEAALAWPDRLKPTLSFDTVARDESLEAALAEVVRATAEAIGSRSSVIRAPDADPKLRALGRAALAADRGARKGPLADAPLWPTLAGGWASLDQVRDAVTPAAPSSPPPPEAAAGRRAAKLADRVATAKSSTSEVEKSPKSSTSEIEKPGKSSTPVAVAFVQHPPKERGAAVPGGRLVLVLDAVDAHRIGRAIEAPVVLVPFGPAVGRVDEGDYRPVGDALEKICADALLAEGSTSALVVAFRDGSVRGLCATAERGRVIRTFAGVALHEEPTPDGMGAIVVLEDERATPTPTWDGLFAAPTPPTAAALQRLADVVRVLTRGLGTDKSMKGVVTSLSHLGIESATLPELGSWAFAALRAAGGFANTKSKLARTLSDVPSIEVLDEHGRPGVEAASGVRRTHVGTSVPYLEDPPGFPTAGWRPMLARTRARVVALEEVLGCKLVEASKECERRREIFRLEEMRKRILERPPIPLAGPIAGAHPSSPTAAGGAADKKNALRAIVALRINPATAPGPATLRFNGRDVATAILAEAPPQVVIVVDTTSAVHLDGWTRISNLGREVASAAVLEAAKSLASMLVTESAGVPFEDSLLATEGACDLITGLLPRAPSLKTVLQGATVMLESAFGGRVPLQSAWGDGPTPVARRSFPADAAARSLQVPILLQPQHLALERLLQAAGLALQDVTRALAEATGDHSAPARLPGSPQHPSFRAHFSNLGAELLGAELLDGEVELVEPTEGGIELLVLGDSVQTAAPDLPFAIRAIARPLRIDTRPKAIREVASKIAAAATRMIDGLAPSVDALPPLAAAAVRACVRQAAEAGNQPRRPLQESPAFMDAEGRSWSLAQLLARRVRFTTDDPPYAETARAFGGEPAVFRFDPQFGVALRKLGAKSVVNVTNDLRLDAEAQARANAPPVPPELPSAVRTRCFAVTPIGEDGAGGEVGLLAPGYGELATVHVHLGGRPLCQLTAEGGWPCVAVVDDPGLQPNRRHDGLAPTSQAADVLQRVRSYRDATLSRRAAPPPGAWAATEVQRSLSTLEAFGSLWLSEDDPDAVGTVVVHWAATREEERRISGGIINLGDGCPLTLEARDAVPGWVKALPISGVLFVTPAAPRTPFDGGIRSLLGSIAVDALAACLEAKRKSSNEVTPRWQWAAALWGAPTVPPPTLDTGGKQRRAPEIVRELRRRGAIWSSRHAGSVDGEFPDEAPSFIVVDDGRTPLVNLLQARAPALIREIGAISSTPGAISSTSEPVSPADARPRRPRVARDSTPPAWPIEPGPPGREMAESSPISSTPEVVTAETESTSRSSTPEPTWLSRMGGLVADWTRSPSSPSLDPKHAVAIAVSAAAQRLGRTAPKVAGASSGRALTYSVREDTVRIWLEHAAIARLLAQDELETIAAAAIGEMNRLLEQVTDAEETRAAASLIEQRAARRRDG